MTYPTIVTIVLGVMLVGVAWLCWWMASSVKVLREQVAELWRAVAVLADSLNGGGGVIKTRHTIPIDQWPVRLHPAGDDVVVFEDTAEMRVEEVEK